MPFYLLNLKLIHQYHLAFQLFYFYIFQFLDYFLSYHYQHTIIFNFFLMRKIRPVVSNHCFQIYKKIIPPIQFLSRLAWLLIL